MLKLHKTVNLSDLWPQPPSGGCVLKHLALYKGRKDGRSAAFGRLCVETAVNRRKRGGNFVSRLRAAVC